MSADDVEQRKRVEKEVREDLRKTVTQLVADVHDESVNASPEHAPLTRTLARYASLICVLAVQADIQTRRIVGLTWALVFLTAALLIFTGYLSYDAYVKSQGDHTEQHHDTEQP